ncbi:MAG TPA: YceI family protein [Micromonosporaceae bacterium]|jgi:polyisoprenoid-binding protein YceI|nr:YceI family protein [Micromonosporaceae bacterium]
MTASTTAATREWNGAAIPAPGRFVLDPQHTRVGFLARHLMVSKVRGSFTGVSGEITVAEDPTASSVTAVMDAATITTGTPDRDTHLRSADFLDVETHPVLTFTSKRQTNHDDTSFTLVGDLTIKNVTREVPLRVEFEGHTINPWGKEVIGFTARTEIDREDFGMTWNVALETGGVLVGRKVTIEIEAEAIRQD